MRSFSHPVLRENTLLAATAFVALTAGTATGGTVRPAIEVHGAATIAHPSKPPRTVLWNQNSDGSGAVFDSQNFTSGSFSSIYNSAGADDFILPRNARMTGVDVTGEFLDGSGPAKGANALLYTNGHNVPYRMLATGHTDSGGPNFVITIKHNLKAGKRYWISVAANCSFVGGCGEWGWGLRKTNVNDPAVWENPGGGFGTACSSWKPIGDCTSYTSYQNADFMFDVTGRWQ